jgi:hypothetical protein
VVESWPKFGDENLSEKFSSERKICKIDPCRKRKVLIFNAISFDEIQRKPKLDRSGRNPRVVHMCVLQKIGFLKRFFGSAKGYFKIAANEQPEIFVSAQLSLYSRPRYLGSRV